MNWRLSAILLAGTTVILLVVIIVMQQGNQETILPTTTECRLNFVSGVTTYEELKKTIGDPTKEVKRGPFRSLLYNTKYDAGCSYTFDQMDKLQNIGAYDIVH